MIEWERGDREGLYGLVRGQNGLNDNRGWACRVLRLRCGEGEVDARLRGRYRPVLET